MKGDKAGGGPSGVRGNPTRNKAKLGMLLLKGV